MKTRIVTVHTHLSFRWRALATMSATVWIIVVLTTLSATVSAQAPRKQSRTTAIQFMLELASDFADADPSARAETTELIDKQADLSSKEVALAKALFALKSDSRYRSLAPAQDIQALDYLGALRISYARFKGAQSAGDHDWSAKQYKAAQEYAALAAHALAAEAQLNEGDVARLQGAAFAVRRPPQRQAAFVEKIRTTGLSAEHHRLLADIGGTEAEIKEFQEQLLQTPPDLVGRSAVEWLSDIAAVRRELSKRLNDFAQADPGALTETRAQTFVVGNPHDRQETVDLFIRPISIPLDWKLSVVNAEQMGGQKLPAGDPPQYPVREAEPGKHYVVTLPAKGQVKVASVVIPVGEIGANTTARWAVEGKIGNELIGGMVHEMNVPYIIADLKLPPVGSKEVEEELPVPPKPRARLAAEVAAGIVILGLLVYFLIFWRRRRQGNATAS